MGNFDPSPPVQGEATPASYPSGGRPTTPSLANHLAARIAAEGPLPFHRFMAEALYHPEAGYYARGTRRVGREGDFFTSVSVGPLFGQLLARRFLRHHAAIGRPARWRILECGADDGSLASDVLEALQELDASACEGLDYVVSEPLPRLAAIQRERLRGWDRTLRWVSGPEALASDPLPGLAFGNEVLDALPCHVVERQGGRWIECRVAADGEGGFAWSTSPVEDPCLAAALAPLGDDFAEGHRTEVRTGLGGFLAPLAAALVEPLMLWIDYGFARSEYHHPARHEGTLRTFCEHRAGDDPLDDPGACDITAHVDFTAVAETAMVLGGRVLEFQRQGAWLTDLARDWLSSLEGRPDPSALRQFQTLTHPAHLGARFHALELAWHPALAPVDPDAIHRRLWDA